MSIVDDRDTKYFTERTKFKKRCKCGHNVSISPLKEKVICSWCGNYIFNNKKDEFLYRFKEAKNKGVKEWKI